MPKNEIAFTKQALTATRDWDAYQLILRLCLGKCQNRQEQKPRQGKVQ